jgi:type II secretory pathway component PulJ
VRLLRVQFTVRRMMVAVALLALLIAMGRLIHRSIHYRRIADQYAKLETYAREEQTMFREMASMYAGNARRRVEYWGPFDNDQHRASVESQTPEGVEANYYRQVAKQFAALADWSSTMKRRYEHATSYPWDLVPPDPPRPSTRFPYRMPR